MLTQPRLFNAENFHGALLLANLREFSIIFLFHLRVIMSHLGTSYVIWDGADWDITLAGIYGLDRDVAPINAMGRGPSDNTTEKHKVERENPKSSRFPIVFKINYAIDCWLWKIYLWKNESTTAAAAAATLRMFFMLSRSCQLCVNRPKTHTHDSTM